MTNFRPILFAFALLLAGCQLIDFHPYSEAKLETLSESEVRSAIDKFAVQMARSGWQQLLRPSGNNSHYARFSTSVAPPIHNYFDLEYTPEDGFVLKFSRATVVSPFTDERINDIKQLAEQFISEATSKKVPLRVYVELP
jgi:hypothetical protein